GAQLAADALLEPVGVAVEDVAAVEARRRRPFDVRVLDRGLRPEHRLEGQAEAPGEGVEHGQTPTSSATSSGWGSSTSSGSSGSSGAANIGATRNRKPPARTTTPPQVSRVLIAPELPRAQSRT